MITLVKTQSFWMLCILLLLPFLLLSQGRNERVTIVGSYQPIVKEASKINFNPAEPDNNLQTIDFEYTDPGYRLSLTIEPPLLAYQQVKTDEKNQTYRNYLKAALGSNLSPIFVFQHHSALSKKTSFDLGLKHMSSWTRVKDFGPSTWMQNALSTSIRTEISDYIWQNSLDYNHDWLHYYGFMPEQFADTLYSEETLRQHYQRLNFATQVKSNYKNTNRLHNHFGIAYAYFDDHYENVEHLVSLKGGLNKSHDWFNVDGEQHTLADIRINFLSATNSEEGIRAFYGELNPKLQLTGSFYAVEAGLLFGFGNDTTAFLNLHPQLSGKLFVFDNKVEIYAGFGGMRQLHTLERITFDNPFVNPGQERWWSNMTHDFKAGVKTGVIPNTDFHAGLQYRKIENGGFYVTDSLTVLKNQLTVQHDNYSLLSLYAQASFHLNRMLVSSIMVQYNQYTLEKLKKPWHKPALEASFDLTWQLDEKWNLNLGLIAWGERFASGIDTSEVPIRLNPAIDLNLKTSYQITGQFGIFAQLSNVFNNRYERYYHYPVQGAQLYAGLNLQF